METIKGHLCYMKNVDNETLIEDGTNNDPYENENDGHNVDDDDDEQASTSKKTRKKQDKEDIVRRFVFFDFETTQEHMIEETEHGTELQHVPNLCIAQTFALQAELIKYWDSDVDILLKACIKFWDLFMAETTRPDECKDEMSKKRYLNVLTMCEGIELDPLKIDRNAGRRALAKLMLNSFWGKYHTELDEDEKAIKWSLKLWQKSFELYMISELYYKTFILCLMSFGKENGWILCSDDKSKLLQHDP
uniref:DNA-directed DNA polymerase n=1 Tax=Romanomermis culicivorax TaxID=13658 RepID=A0A915IQ27_ROMCU